VILPATYPLVIAMLLGLVFRGVAFEYRWRDPGHRALWDAAFTGGSLVAALAQGMILGALLQGIEVDGRAYAGSWWDWLTPYTLLTGLGTVAGYALLGATWLIWKLDGAEQDHARKLAIWAGGATIALMGAVSLYNIALNEEYASHWLTAPQIYWVAPVPIVTAIVSLSLLHGILNARNSKPFWLSIALFFLGMSGLGVTIWPYVVPPGITICDAAAPERSQIFMLVGVGITMPLIIGYTVWAYWVFRGKVADEGYH
jgi:cytochrome bd ubiquinol oxidase subunit II